MTYLLLSILCSTAIFIIFKYFDRLGINTFTAIVINYLFAAITGFVSIGAPIQPQEFIHTDWFFNSIFLGLVFITLFNIMALTAQKLGASVASVANKMALVVPVVYAIIYFNDSINFLKICGIVLALIGVYLATTKPSKQRLNWKLAFMPLLLFFGSGFIDTFIKYNQEYHLNSEPLAPNLFSAITFLTACSIGFIILIVDKSKRKFNTKTILGGVVLGIINYGSIYFLIQTFNYSEMESSVVFPINNMAVVLLTTVTSFLLFQERFSKANKAGILISIISLLFILYSQ